MELSRRLATTLEAARQSQVSGSFCWGRWRFVDCRDGRACTLAVYELQDMGLVHISWDDEETSPTVEAT